MSQMFPKPKDQMDKKETRDPDYDILCADCSKSWRNAEKILNKIRRAPKGCRTATRRKISTCRPRDKN